MLCFLYFQVSFDELYGHQTVVSNMVLKIMFYVDSDDDDDNNLFITEDN